MAIKKVHWDFGNGETSNELNPIVQYEPGVYTVILTITDSDGITHTKTRTAYVNVGETSTTLASGDYIDYPKCLHYGWKDEHGFGWSFNEGEFPWPLTPASICEYEEDGILYTLVYDIIDGKEYHINTHNSHVGKAVYKDKGIHSIETEVITPEFTGEMKSYDVSHVETNVKYKPDILQDSFDDDFSVSISLITDSGQEPVETQYKVNADKEIMFYYQNKQTKSTRQRQLKFNTSESNFQLMNYESYFKSNDKYKRATINESMAVFGAPLEWYTRGKGYNFNRSDGTTNTSTVIAQIQGPDGLLDSAATIPYFELGNTSSRSSMALWSISEPATTPVIPFVAYGDPIDGWQLYYYNGTIPAGLTTGGSFFDIRMFNTTLSEDVMLEYRDKFKKYLPRG